MMKMQKWRGKMIIGLCGLLLLLGGVAGRAQAGDCTYFTGLSAGINYSAGQATYSFTVPATISITGAEAPGTVLWTSSLASGDKPVYATCSGGAGSAGLIDNYGHTSTSSSGAWNVFPTNVAGIGFAISFGAYTSGVRGYPSNPDGSTPNNDSNAQKAILRFIKTSDAYFSGTSASTNISGDLATWYVGTNKLRLANFRISNTTTFTRSDGGGGGGTTCSLRTTPVNLGSAKASDFKSVGAKGPVVSNFFTSVDITCPSATRTAKLTFSSATAVAGSPGIFRDTSARGQGIGIIFMQDDGSSPVRFGQQFSVDLVSVGSNKVGSFPFSAAMIKISDPVLPGSVNGAIVATLSVN